MNGLLSGSSAWALGEDQRSERYRRKRLGLHLLLNRLLHTLLLLNKDLL
jgi:hypothetical protein